MVEASRLGPGVEFDLIRRFLERGAAPGADIRVGPGDDAAVIAPGIVASADLSIEGVHFRRDWIDPEEIGYRACAAALSDLAAMAARPIGVLAACAFPDADVPDTAVRVAAGIREAAEHAGAAVLGGDVSRSPGPLIIDVAVLGAAVRPVLRSGARPGDALWVTGRLGGAAAAVLCWQTGAAVPAAARAAFARPRPRIPEARWLAEHDALHALIDLSDGLAGDATHLAAAADVGIVLDASTIPVHPAARQAVGPEEALRLALTGGEDYELCFAAPPRAIEAVASAFEATWHTPLTRVGEVVPDGGVRLRRADGSLQPLDAAGFDHFRRDTR
ncbi:MAG TPA: thiamine-phosphate kinase [Longimicrobiales bacterium]